MGRISKYPEKVETLGEKIKAARLNGYFCLTDIEKNVGLSNGYLSRLENGCQPSLELAEKLAKFLKFKLSKENYIELIPKKHLKLMNKIISMDNV